MIYWPDSWNHQKRNKGRFVWTWTAWIELKSEDFIAGTIGERERGQLEHQLTWFTEQDASHRMPKYFI